MFFPIVGGALAHAPVLRCNWLRALKRPLDGGATFRGRRVFGDNKTWRGAFCVVAGTTLTALALSFWPWYWRHLPEQLQSAPPALFGFLLGVGTIVAEFPNSFLKRQLGVAPGGRLRGSIARAVFTFYDQADLVFGVWLLLLPLWVMPWSALLFALVVVSGAHLLSNVIGYAIGARQSWL